ncbi:MAG: serine hydrolase [Flavobacteriaceae bacterium]|nr:serine hydrolase [Flavobacteriaceae bacterium]
MPFFCFFSLSAQNSLPDNWDQWLENGRIDWQIPGMAVGIVKDGKIIYAKGFGETQLGNNEAVNEHTVFSIASVSKNITAAALAILVDRGQINWDDKIIEHIPWFQMKDAYNTREITIRDALIHRVGLGRVLGNRLQFMTQNSRDDVLRSVKFMDLEKEFRSGFVYSNVMYSFAGQVIPYTDGRSWDDFLVQELFQPLGMYRSNTSIIDLEKMTNIAFPHQEINGKIVPIDRRNWDNAGPAGGVNSSIHDLNHWMLMQLGNSGEFESKTIISTKQMNEIHRPQISTAGQDPLAPQSAYGLGWQIFDYKGKRVWTHSGATDGFNSFMYLFPELELGVVMAGNTFNSFGVAVAYHIMDHYLNEKDRDWNQFFLERYKDLYSKVQKKRNEIDNSQIKNTNKSFRNSEYTGLFHSDAYGQAEIKIENNQLVIRLWDDLQMEGVLEHWHYDTFRIIWKNRALREEFMQFYMDKSGKVSALDIEFSLRPELLQVGAYPSNYTRTVKFSKL